MQATLLPSSLPTIDDVASLLHARPGIRVRIEGHVNPGVSPKFARTLSQVGGANHGLSPCKVS